MATTCQPSAWKWRAVGLVREESLDRKAGRDLVLARLVELLLIEALRAVPAQRAAQGLPRGLANKRLAVAIRALHADPARRWSVEQLARKSALSRSAFFDRFTRAGCRRCSTRMAIARDLLRHKDLAIAKVAERVGCGSASTFSTAFSRHIGKPPGLYARMH